MQPVDPNPNSNPALPELPNSYHDTSISISDIHSLPRPKALDTLSQIGRIEKKTFPTNEAFNFDNDLWKKKPNTRVLYATITTINKDNAGSSPISVSSPPQQQQQQQPLIAYAVYVRQKGIALLHKLCVAEPYRQRGIGRKLMDYIRSRLEKEGCQYIQLWVDKARVPARSLYVRCGFEEREEVADYYAPGRTGIRMVLGLD